MEHFLSMKQLTPQKIKSLIQMAEQFNYEGKPSQYSDVFAANLFLEPSTRTKMSFTVAQHKMGITPLDFHVETSSAQKGETLYDTARTFESIGANLLVVRHPEENAIASLAEKMSIPIINAGDGAGEHPTQSMLDLHTIYQDFHGFKGLKVAIAGDIRHSRVARSNAYALNMLGAEVSLVAKDEWKDHSLPYSYQSMDEAVESCDVLMLLRIQHERHESKYTETPSDYLTNYGLTKQRERKMKKHAIILHPAPVNRGVEIADELVECSRSRIFKQMTNGVTMRMAITAHVLEEWGIRSVNHHNKRKTFIVQ